MQESMSSIVNRTELAAFDNMPAWSTLQAYPNGTTSIDCDDGSATMLFGQVRSETAICDV